MSQVLVTESYISDIASAIRSKNGQSASYYPSQMASAIDSIVSAGDLSVISKSINTNGTYNPASDNADAFSGVVVDVPNTYNISDEGKVVASGALLTQGALSVYSNSIYDTTLFSQVNVDVSQPVLVSKTITENGTYDPAEDNADAYSQVVVNVSGGGGSSNDLLIAFGAATGTIENSIITYIPIYAFYSRNMNHFSNAITGISIPNVKIIEDYGFYDCKQLEYITCPLCERIGTNAFYSCYNLESISCPNVSTLGNSAFVDCYKLSFLDLRNVEKLNPYTFRNCSMITSLLFEKLSLISGSSAFAMCSRLESLYLLSTQVVTLSRTNCFANTPMSFSTWLGRWGSIFVPASLVDAYKSASNWSYYSNRITAYVEE